MTYAVFCYRFDKPSVKIQGRLSLADAQAWCRDPETSSSTTTSWQLMKRHGKGPWFYGYTKE